MNNCSCIYVGDYDLPKLHRSKVQVARKIHICCECSREIKPFEKYEYVVGVWDYHFSTYKTCSDCLSIRKEFFCDGWAYTMMNELLWEHIQEMMGEIPEDCLNVLSMLTAKAKEMVCNMIEEYWADMEDD